MGFILRVFLFGLVAMLSAQTGSVSAGTVELLMLEQPGCVWCKRWNEEIGVAYPRTSEGKQAPLRRIDITDPWPVDLADVRPERLTPTFILVAEGQEVARLRGYPGEHFFWPLLADMLGELPKAGN